MTSKLSFHPPVIQAPMAGGGDTPALVSAVSNAGGLGFIGAAYLTPAQIRDTAKEVRWRTDRPFGINLFAPCRAGGPPDDHDMALQKLAPLYADWDYRRHPCPPMPTIDSKKSSPPRSIPARLTSASLSDNCRRALSAPSWTAACF